MTVASKSRMLLRKHTRMLPTVPSTMHHCSNWIVDLLERILSDLLSTGVNAGVNGSTLSGSVPECPKAASRASREQLRLSPGS